MNCRKDDLAIFVKINAGNQGKIVRCLRLASSHELDAAWFDKEDGPVWWVDAPVKQTAGGVHAGVCMFAKDSYLRPIRPQSDDATDEMVQKLGKPEGVTA